MSYIINLPKPKFAFPNSMAQCYEIFTSKLYSVNFIPARADKIFIAKLRAFADSLNIRIRTATVCKEFYVQILEHFNATGQWIQYTCLQWQKILDISYREFRSARRLLSRAGLIEERKYGRSNVLHFKPNHPDAFAQEFVGIELNSEGVAVEKRSAEGRQLLHAHLVPQALDQYVEAIEEWLQYLYTNHKGAVSEKKQKQQIKKIESLLATGLDPVWCIKKSISSGWHALYDPRKNEKLHVKLDESVHSNKMEVNAQQQPQQPHSPINIPETDKYLQKMLAEKIASRKAKEP